MSHDWSWSVYESGAPISLMEKCNDEHLYMLSCALTFVVCAEMRLFPGSDKSHFVQSHEKGGFLYAYAFCRCAMREEKIQLYKRG